MTGNQFWVQLQDVLGKDYSAYFDNATANDIIFQGFIKAIEKKYPDIISQKNSDELDSLIRTNVSYTLTNNQVSLVSGISDYCHLLALKATFEYQIAQVKGASNQTPIILTLDRINNLRSGEQIIISGVTGNANANGTQFVKKLADNFVTNSFTYALYSDAKLTTPVVGNGNYISGGSVKKVIADWVEKKNSYRKISVFGTPVLTNAYYEIADGNLKILPDTETCTGIRLDYIKKPTVLIDVADTTIDLELTYPARWLYYIMDETSRLMFKDSRDTSGQQSATIELQQP